MSGMIECSKEKTSLFSRFLGYIATALCMLHSFYPVDVFVQNSVIGFSPQLLLGLSGCLLLVKFIIDEHRTPLLLGTASLVVIVCLLGLTIVPMLVVHRGSRFLVLVLFAIGFCHGSCNQFVKTVTVTLAVFLSTHFLLYAAGYYGDTSYLQFTGERFAVRHRLGFSNANQPLLLVGAALLGLLVLTRSKNLLRVELLIFSALLLILFCVTNSRTSFIALGFGFFLIAGAYSRIFGTISRFFLSQVVPWGFLILLGVSLLIAFQFGEGGNSVSRLLSHRPECWLFGLQSTDFLWGGNLESAGSILSYEDGKVPVDSFFVNLVVHQGFILTLLYSVLFCWFAKRCAVRNQYALLGALWAVLLCGFGENNINIAVGFLFVLPILELFSGSRWDKAQKMMR